MLLEGLPRRLKWICMTAYILAPMTGIKLTTMDFSSGGARSQTTTTTIIMSDHSGSGKLYRCSNTLGRVTGDVKYEW
jgi:hypothetical protein